MDRAIDFESMCVGSTPTWRANYKLHLNDKFHLDVFI